MEYNGGVPNGGFGFYNFSQPQVLLTPNYLGTDQYLVAHQVAGNTLSFQMPLSDLVASGTSVNQIATLQVNFITTNVTPPPGDTLPDPPKIYGSLQFAGQGGNSFLNIPVAPGGTVQPYSSSNTTSATVFEYVNGQAQPVMDVPQVTVPDLTVTNFTIQITSG